MQTFDTKPKRRLFEVLKAQGMQANQQVTFLTDGGEDIRDLPLYLNAQAEHLLDWFHLTMRITVMANMAKSLRPPQPDPEIPDEPPADLANEIGTQLQRLKWFCWHGNVFRALQAIDDILFDLDITEPCPEQARLLKAVREFDSYIRANAGRIPNYGERQRAGEAISTAFTESAVNQVISKRMVKNSRCAGHPAAPTCCSRSAPASSTTSSPATFTAGTPASAGHWTPWRSRRSLPTLSALRIRRGPATSSSTKTGTTSGGLLGERGGGGDTAFHGRTFGVRSRPSAGAWIRLPGAAAFLWR